MAENEIIVFIDWIRHGFSCANAIKMQGHVGPKNILKNVIVEGNLGDSRGVYAADSLLSDLGIRQAERVNNTFFERIQGYDLILSSELSRATETAMIVAKNSKVKTIYMVPYISEERSKASFSLDTDNQARDPQIIKTDLESIFTEQQGYPTIDTSFVERFKGQYNSKNKTSPNFKLFYEKVLPYVLSKKLPKNRNIFNIAIVSHNFFINKIFKTRYPNYLKHPINNLQINTEIIKLSHNKMTFELPPMCNDDKFYYCQIPVDLQNKIINKPDKLEKNDVTRCISLSNKSNKVEQLFNFNKGGYYDKYIKYKSKYLDLKNSINNQNIN